MTVGHASLMRSQPADGGLGRHQSRRRRARGPECVHVPTARATRTACVLCAGFRMPAISNVAASPGPASESLQGRNPRGDED